MGEYLLSVVVMSAFVGVIDYFSYPSGTQKTVKASAALILIYTVIVPVLSIASSLGEIRDDFMDIFEVEVDTEGEYLKVSEEAFCEGVRELVASEFSIPKSDVRVSAFGFDFSQMRAKTIKITLFKEAFFADWRGIQQYIKGLGIGDCEVNVSFE